jgi:hypothetical protein
MGRQADKMPNIGLYSGPDPRCTPGPLNDPRNLWHEPGAGPNTKDDIEDRLRAAVYDDRIAPATAHREIATNWAAAGRTSRRRPAETDRRPTSGAPTPE